MPKPTPELAAEVGRKLFPSEEAGLIVDVIERDLALTLVRLVPQWYSDAGPISISYATRTLLPAKARVFVDFTVDAFRKQQLAERFSGSIG